MVDNLAEKVDECLGSLCIVCVQLGARKVSIKRSSGVFTIQGFLMYEEMIRIVHYIMGVHCWGVSIKRGSIVLPIVHLAEVHYSYKLVSNNTLTFILGSSGMADIA